MTAKAIGYLRVSTAEQRESGLGLAAQESACRAAAARLTLPWGDVFVDAGLSGSLPIERRPALASALAALRRGDVLLVAKRDRLGRDVVNVAIAERLVQKKGARIVSAAGEASDDTGPAGQLMRTLLDAFSQFERALISQRVSSALAVKKSRGERISGRLPYGFQLAGDGRSLEVDTHEQRVLGELRALRAAGLTFEAIAIELNRRGFTMRSGRPWQRIRVHALARDVQRTRRAA